MKIIQINAVYPKLSTGNLCYEIEKRIIDEGHECVTIYGEKNGYTDTVGDRCFNSKLDRKVHAFMSRLTGKQGHFSRLATSKMIRFIDSFAPDLVYISNLHGNYINLPMIMGFLAEKKIPVAVNLCDCFFYTGKCTHYIDIGCEKWKTGCGNCPKKKKGNVSWFFDRTKSLWNEKKDYFSKLSKLGIVCATDWVMNDAKKSFLSYAGVIKRIYLWTDTNVYRPHDASYLKEKLNIKNKKVILGISTIWNAHKGINVFMELSNLISYEYVIVMVGNADSEKYKSNDKIIFVGSVMDREVIADYYSMADVFVNPSVAETFGLTYVEAMASGTPNVAYASLAARELVGDDGRFGMLVEKNDAQLYYDAIKKVTEKGKAAYAEKCRANAVAKFEKDKILTEYMHFISDLVGK